MPKSVINGNANLLVPAPFPWRTIDAPEMATSISLKGLENET
jgi:hypothetical protein